MKKHTSSAKNIKLNLGSVADAIQQKNVFYGSGSPSHAAQI